jgi:hypothetical protein
MADPLGDMLSSYAGPAPEDYSGYEDFVVEGKKVGIYNPKLGVAIAGDPRGAKPTEQPSSGDPLGDMISGAMSGQPIVQPPTPAPDINAPTQPPLPANLQDYGKSVYGWKDYAKRATLLPMAEDEKGDLHFAMPQAGVDMLNSALLPGFASKGGQYTYGDTLGLAAMASPMSAAGRAGELAPGFVRPRLAKPKVPTIEELKSAAKTGYDGARDMGVTYTSDSVRQMADHIAQTLDGEGRIAELNPETFALLKKLQNPPDGSFATLDALQALRKRLGDINMSPDKSKSAAASIAMRKLDEFIEHGRVPGDVPGAPMAGSAAAQAGINVGSGTAEQASRVLKDARGNSAAAFRAESLAALRDVTELRAAAANSGHNTGNVIRQRLASLLSTPQKTRGFSPEELDAMRQVVQGTASTNTLREISNHLGGGGGLGQTFLAAMGAGAGTMLTHNTAGAVIGAAVPAIAGSATRALGNHLTKKGLTDIEKMVRMRSPLGAQRAAIRLPIGTTRLEMEMARRLLLQRALQAQPQNPMPMPGGMNPQQSKLGLLE